MINKEPNWDTLDEFLCSPFHSNPSPNPIFSPNQTPIKRDKIKKPKRNKSAFILFSSEMRKVLKQESNGQINSNEMMVKLANLWKDLNPKDKEKYFEQAEQDKTRYSKELDLYLETCPSGVIKNKTKKNHVRKPCSSYAIFVKEMKEVVRKERPELKMADILKIIAERWKLLSEEDKAIYQEKSRIDKEFVRAKLDEQSTKEQIKAEIKDEFIIHRDKNENMSYQTQGAKKKNLDTFLHEDDLELTDTTYKCLKTENHQIKNLLNSKDMTLSTSRTASNTDHSQKVDEGTKEAFGLDFPDFDFQAYDYRFPTCQVKEEDAQNIQNAQNTGKLLNNYGEDSTRKNNEFIFDFFAMDLSRQKSESMGLFDKSSMKLNSNIMISVSNNNSQKEALQGKDPKSGKRGFWNNIVINTLKNRTENDLFKEEVLYDPNFIDLQI